jgi:hypothetical protein
VWLECDIGEPIGNLILLTAVRIHYGGFGKRSSKNLRSSKEAQHSITGIAMNEIKIAEPVELEPSELYAIAGGYHAGYHQIFRDLRSGGQVNISLISVVVEIGNDNRVTSGPKNNNGNSSVDIGNGNEIIVHA